MVFDYLFPKGEQGGAVTNYNVDVYFVLPGRLGIDANTYSKDDFYGAMKPLTRFLPPSLAKLQEEDGDRMPHLKRLRQKIAEGERLENLDVVAREAKLFGCAFVHRYARRSAKIRRLVRKKVTGLSPTKPNMKSRIDLITGEIEACYNDLEEFRGIVNYLLQNRKRISAKHFETIGEVDEYCTYRIREELLALKNLFSGGQAADEGLFTDLFEKIDATLITEREHASNMGYYWPMAESPEVVFEAFGRRRAALKQSVWSVLFLDLRSSKLFRFQTHFGAMVAAGFAAAWALTAQIWVVHLSLSF